MTLGAARRLGVLFVRMLRYRVAVMIWLFMLLGAAFHGGLGGFRWAYVWAAAALAGSFVAATTVNDIADEAIDQVNHPVDRGRPLVSGEASVRDLRFLHLVGVAVAVVAGTVLGPVGLALAVLSVMIGRLYSLPPVRLSYRTYLAPTALGVAYVVIPYGFGLVAAGISLRPSDPLFAGSLYALFLARINLKDFRDREGDARYGRPTLLLRFGKRTTCLVSGGALLAGNALLLAAVRPVPLVAVLIELFVGAIGWQLRALWSADGTRAEQVAIGIGARMGNGLLIAVLGCLVLRAQGATGAEQSVFALALTALFGIGFWSLASRPEEVLIGYKG
ncbi:MAG TPA: UbiA prenyltransferase family protein [Actinomycetota bacterium]